MPSEFDVSIIAITVDLQRFLGISTCATLPRTYPFTLPTMVRQGVVRQGGR